MNPIPLVFVLRLTPQRSSPTPVLRLAVHTAIGALALFFAILVLSGGTKPYARVATKRQEDDQHVGVDQGVHHGGLHYGMASYTRT